MSGREALPEQPKGIYLTPRQMFWIIAIVLAIVLVGLLIYLLFALNPRALVIDGGETQAGIKPILTIEGPGTGEHPTFDRPLGAAYSPGGRIYVSDTGNNRICVFSEQGRFLFEFGSFGVAKPAQGAKATWKEGSLNFPAGIDIDDDGSVYVADFRNDTIEVFNADGAFLRRFPDPLKPAGKGSSGQENTGIAVTDVAVQNGYVYALDTYQVVVFKTDGTFVRQFGKPGSGVGELDHPNGIAVAPDGSVYVSDSNNNRVVAFDASGAPLWTTGKPIDDLTSRVDYEFGLPRGITLAQDRGIIVVDAFEFSLVQLSDGGTVVGRFGERGVEPAQMNFPNGIDSRGSRLLVSDKENNRVLVVELVNE